MPDFPAILAPSSVEPVPRRVRAVVAGVTILDTTRAVYVWDVPYYPQFNIPLADVADGVLIDEDHVQQLKHGPARRHGIRVGSLDRAGAAHVYGADAADGIANTVRFDWAAIDAWYEEDEQIFVHPRNPYARVDALRSTRTVRVELDGLVLAQSSSPVLVFETGLPTRYYLGRPDVNLGLLTPSDTQTACPYKGVTTGYWSLSSPAGTHRDIAWAYDFPTLAVQPIAGLIAFYNEKVDLYLDGELLERP